MKKGLILSLLLNCFACVFHSFDSCYSWSDSSDSWSVDFISRELG
jgi:hypothetical protein